MSEASIISSASEEDVKWLELSTDFKGLINSKSLSDTYSKSGLSVPDFVINPKREKVK